MVPRLPAIDLSPFPDLLKHYSLYILKRHYLSYNVKNIDLADMAPFGAEKHVFRWSRQLGKSSMDSFWMISGFFGPSE